MTIKEIYEPIREHLEEFDIYFKQKLNSNVSLISLIISYLTKKKGKQVRPALVFLSAAACGEINERTYNGAAMVEMLHIATLIHDDVVDEADKRRGMASINAAWNNKIAVLIGDFLLAKGMLSAIDNSEFNFLKATSNAVRRMSEGELLQIHNSKKHNIELDVYFKIISNKTGSLLATCCEIGAISTNEDLTVQSNFREFGENLGIAFQIKDDILDYQGKSEILGKPIGNDIKEKKITLPLIYSLSKSDKTEKKKIISLIKDGNPKKKDINFIKEFVIKSGGMDYSEKIAKEYSNKAISYIENIPDSIYKQSLINFANFVIERNI